MFGDDDGWARMLPQFVNLTLAGALLAWAYQRTGNLWFSIGLHAGWIFWLAAYRLFTSEVPDTAVWWWGGSKLIDGWLTTLTLGLALVLFGRFNRSTGTTGLRSVA
jgi:hypothetical protein